LPLKLINTTQGWIYVRDWEGQEGWMAKRLLSRIKTALVVSREPIALMSTPNTNGHVIAWLNEGVVVRILKSQMLQASWLYVDTMPQSLKTPCTVKGWIHKSGIVSPHENF
jgi:SH3-like domain-containing protein